MIHSKWLTLVITQELSGKDTYPKYKHYILILIFLKKNDLSTVSHLHFCKVSNKTEQNFKFYR